MRVLGLGLSALLLAMPVTAGLVSWWDFNDGTGNGTAADSVGGHTGTLVNMDSATDWVSGHTGAAGDFALDFDGSAERVQIDGATGFKGITGVGSRTLSAWIKTSNPSDVFASWGSNAVEQKAVYRTNENGGPRLEVNGGYIIGKTDVRGAGWTHIAFTWENDGTPDVTDSRVYVNGVLDTPYTTQSTAINTNDGQNVRIGGESFGTRHFNGQIDDVAIWNRSLTAAEIASLAGGAAPTSIATVVPDPMLSYVANADGDTTDATWDNQSGLPDNSLDWTLNNNAAGARYTAVSDDAKYGTSGAYTFSNAAGDTATMGSVENFPGNPTDEVGDSFEILFRPADTVGQEILFETGGSGTGTSLAIDGSDILFTSSAGAGATTLQITASAALSTDFVHVVGVLERKGDGSADLSLYVDGALAASGNVGSFVDWAGSDGSGLGDTNGSVGGDQTGLLTGYANFTGDIARFKFYDNALTAADVAQLVTALPQKFAGASGAWDTAATWNPLDEPTIGNDTFVGGGATVTINDAGNVSDTLTIGHSQSLVGAENGNGTLTLSSGDLTVTGDIALGLDGTTGALNVNGSGQVNVGGDVTVGSGSGTVGLDTGTLVFDNAGALAADVTVAGGSSGSIDNGGAGTLTLTGAISKDGSTLTLLSSGGGTIDIQGIISGASAASDLVVDGATVTLNAVNTYNGPTYIRNAGTLNANVVGALPDPNSGAPSRSDITLDDSGSGSSVLNINADNVAAGLSGPSSSTVNIAAGQVFTVGAAAGTSTFAGAISGTGSLAKDGISTQVLSGSNSYSGGTGVTDGVLQINTLASLPGAATVAAPGRLRLVNNNLTWSNAITGDGTLEVRFGTGSGNTRLNGIAGFNGTVELTKSGATTADKWHTNGINAPNASALVNPGTQLFVVGNTTLQDISVSGTGNTENRGAIRLNNGSTLNAPITLLGDTTIGTEGTGVINGTISTGAAGNHVLRLGTPNSHSFPANMLNGVISDGTGTLALEIYNGNDGDVFISGAAANTYSGGTTLLNGPGSGTRLRITTITGTPYGSGAITIGQAPTDRAGIYFPTASQTLTNDLVFNTALGTDRPGLRADGTNITLSGDITASLADATFSTNGTGSVNLTGQVTGAEGLLLHNTYGSSITVTLNNGTASPNDYQGDTTIAGTKGTLILGAADQIPNGASAGNLVNNGTFNMNGFNETVNGLSGSGTVDGVSGTPTLTIGDGDASSTYSGTITDSAGTLGVTKIGTGTQTLSGANTYSGNTTVNGGTLQLGASEVIPNASTVAINNSGTVFDLNGNTETIANLNVNPNPTSGVALYVHDAGETLTVTNNITLGGAGQSGNVQQTGGTVNVNSDLVFGGVAGVKGGTYNLDGGVLNVGGDIVETAPNVDGAQLHIDGGTLHVTGDITVQRFAVGQDTGQDGSYTAPAGQAIASTGTTSIGVNAVGTLDLSAAGASLSSANALVGEGGAGDGTVTIDNGNTWTVTQYLRIGNSGRGKVQLKSGTLDVQGTSGNPRGIRLGENGSGDGTLVIGVSGGSGTADPVVNNSGGNFETALNGTGTVTMHSGTLNVLTNNLIVNQGGSSNGTFTLNDGLVDIQNQLRFNGGTGLFEQYGGTVNVGTILDIGNSNGGDGTYRMYGGILNAGDRVTSDLKIGNFNNASTSALMEVIDGTVNVSNGIRIADNGGNSSGTLTIGRPAQDTSPAINLAANLENADNGDGIVNMYSGTVTMTGNNNWIIGQASSGSAEFNMYGGLVDFVTNTTTNGILKANIGDGVVNMTGGTLWFQDIEGANNAAGSTDYNFGGGLVRVDDNIDYRTSGNDSITITGGEVRLDNGGNITLRNSTDVLDLQGGLLNLGGGDIVFGGSSTGSDFSMTGGELRGVGTFGGTLTQGGGTLAPGTSPGITTIAGDYTLNAGTLEIEMNGTSPGMDPGHDVVEVSGTTSLDTTNGNLDVALLGGYSPTAGDTYTIIDTTSGSAVVGHFAGKPDGTIFLDDGARFGIRYDAGTGNDVVLYALPAAVATTMYVDEQSFGLVAPPPFTPVDGDLEQGGTQTAYLTYDAFDGTGGITNAVSAGGTTIFVNDGTYSAADLTAGNITLNLIEGDVTLQSLTGQAGDSIATRYHSGSVGDLTVESGSFGGIISGGGNLTKTTGGTVSLSGANSYTGATSVDEGALEVAGGGSITGTSGIDVGSAGAGTLSVTGGSVSVSGAVTDGGNSALNVEDGALTVSSGLSVDAARVGIAPSGDTDGANATVTVNGGAVNIGGGSGNLDIGFRDSASLSGTPQTVGVLDMSNAASVTIDVANVRMGIINGNLAGEGAARGDLIFSHSGSNALTADSLVAGNSPNRGNGVVSTIQFGGGTNTMDVDTLTLGGLKSQATLTIDNGGTLILTGKTGAAVDADLGFNVTGNTGTTSAGTIDTTGGTLNATFGTLRLGQHNVGSGSGTGTLTFDDGTVTAATIVAATGAGNSVGVINQSGGTLNVTGSFSEGAGDSLINVNSGSMTVGNGLEVDNLNVGTSGVTGTLTVSGGAVQIGENTGDDFNVGRRTSGSGLTQGTVDLSSASSVNVNVGNLRVGTDTTGSGGSKGVLTLSAAGANTIAATNIQMGDTNTGDNVNVSRRSELHLGGSTNQVNVNTFEIGDRKSSGLVDIAAGGSLTLRDRAGTGRADVRIGYNTTGTGTNPAESVLNLAGASSVDALIDELIIGRHGSGSGSGKGRLTIDTGSLDANTLILATASGGGTSSNPGNTTGVLVQNGGALTINDDAAVGRNGAVGDWTATAGTVSIGSGTGSDFDIGRQIAGGGASDGDVDLAGASSVTIDVGNVRLGTTSTGASGGHDGDLVLSAAGTNSVTATNIVLGDTTSGGGFNDSQVSTITLGGAANNFNVNSFRIGGDKSRGTVSIVGGGTLTLLDRAGTGPADLLIGDNNVSTGSNPAESALDLTGGTFNATLDTLVIGRHAGNNGGGKGALIFEAGNSTADSVLLASTTGAVPANTTGRIVQNGGSLAVAGNLSDGGGISTAFLNDGTMTVTGNVGSGSNAIDFLTVGDGVGMAALLAAGGDVTVDALNGGADGTIRHSSGGTNTLTVGAGGATASYSGVIEDGSGAGSGIWDFVKEGAGTQTLSGTNTYSGTTTVQAGALSLDSGGSIANSSLTTIQSGATLTGTGTTGPLTIDDGGTHAPGLSPGITTVVGNYIENGTLSIEIDNSFTGGSPVAGTDYDQVDVTGTVTLGGTSILTPIEYANGGGFNPDFATVFPIINNDGSDAVTGTFSNYAAGDTVITINGAPLNIYYDNGTNNNDVVLVSANIAATPIDLYVDGTFTAPATVDGDREAGGPQAAYVGTNAFADPATALAAYPGSDANIIVNGGSYASALLAGDGANTTLRLVNDTVAAEPDVTIQSLSGDAGDAIVTNYHNGAAGNLIVESGSFAGVISGTGSLTKTTGGTLTLGGPNSYSGGTTLSGGLLILEDADALPGDLTYTNSARTRVGNGADTGQGGVVTFATGAGSQYLDLNGNTFTIAGLTGLATANNLSAVQNNLGSTTGTLIIDNSSDYTYASFIRNQSGTLALTKTGSGTQTLVGDRLTHTGDTTVSGGTLRLSDIGSSWNSDIINNATLEMNATGGSMRVGTGETISGSGTLVKTGAGTVQLYNNTINTTGQWRVEAGVLMSDGNSVNWSGSTADMDVWGAGTLDLYADAMYVDELTGMGTVTNRYGNATGYSGSAAYTEAFHVGVNNGSSTFNGIITDTGISGGGTGPNKGLLELHKDGSGTITLTNNNTYSGLTNITNGTLALGIDDALPITTRVLMGTNSGTVGTLDLNGYDQTVGAIDVHDSSTSGASQAITNSSGTPSLLTVSHIGNSVYTYEGQITGNLALTKTGGAGSVLYLDGNNSYTGLTTVGAGYLVAQSNTALGTAAAGTVVNSGATLQLQFKSTYGNVTITGETATLNGDGVGGTRGAMANWTGNNTWAGSVVMAADSRIYSRTATLTIDGPISESGGSRTLLKTGDGELTFSGSSSNTYSGTTVVADGVLNLDKDGGPGAYAISGPVQMGNGSNLSPYLRMDQDDQFAPGVVLTNVNVWGQWTRFELQGTSQTLAGISDTAYGGVIQNSESGGGGTGILTIDNGSDYTFAGHMRNGNSGVFSLVKDGAGTLTLQPPAGQGARVNYTGATTVDDGTLKLVNLDDSSGSGGLSFNSPVTVNANGILLIDSTIPFASRWNYSQALSGTGTVVKTGSGVFGFTGVNTFDGTMLIQEGRVMNDALTANWSGATADVDVSGGAQLDLRGDPVWMDALTGAGDVINSYGDGTNNLTVGVANGSGTFSGVISGSGDGSGEGQGLTALVKEGAGTQILTGTNTYTGDTTISGGTLVVGDGATSGSIDTTGDIIDNAAFVSNRSDSITIPNSLTGSGTVSQEGTGTVLLTNYAPDNRSSSHTYIRLDDDADFDTGAPTMERVIPGTTLIGDTPGGYGSSAILGGVGTGGDVRLTTTVPGDRTLSMAWRGTAADEGFLLGDVLNLEGLGDDRPFVLEMSYDEALISGNEVEWAEKGGIYVAWLSQDGHGNEGWRNAVLGNLGEGALAQINYSGRWSDFAAAYAITQSDLRDYLGSWGVDTTANLAWAILNHNSEFAVVGIPEPSSLGLLALGLLALGVARRRC